MDKPIIEVKDFTKSYADNIAVNSISFDVRQGEIFGLLGPNGAGKTTTLECLEGLRSPTAGTLIVADHNPGKDHRALRKLIGVQLQSCGLPESITPIEAMKLFCAYHQIQPRIDLLDRFDLSEKRKSQFASLSAGQQRRLSLALAIAHDPKVLFLDEPTAGLDVASRVELHALMQELKSKGTSIVLATHDMAEAEELSDRVAILLNGQIATINTPMEITATGSGLTKISVRTENTCLKNRTNDFPAVAKSLTKDDYSIFFSTHIGTTVSSIITYIDNHSDMLIDLRVERPSLEDRFLEITGNGVKQ